MNDHLVAYLAPEGFEAELEQELSLQVSAEGGSPHLERHGRLFLLPGPLRKAAWAQNVWLSPRKIPIDSIGDAAKKLRALGPRWALYSHTLHRRANLIQDQVPKPRGKSLQFLETLPTQNLGSWTLLAPDLMLASPDCTSPFPNGEMQFAEDRNGPPSRAYLKLWELFTVHSVRPRPGERCLDLGATPGGWTWVLAKMGCRVLAVDRAPLEPRIASMPGVEMVTGNAFTLTPESVGPIDWLFSDVICYPEQIESLVEKWRASGLCRNFVCTLKFKGETDFATSERLARIPGSHLRHLHHNKHELTWWLMSEDRGS